MHMLCYNDTSLQHLHWTRNTVMTTISMYFRGQVKECLIPLLTVLSKLSDCWICCEFSDFCLKWPVVAKCVSSIISGLCMSKKFLAVRNFLPSPQPKFLFFNLIQTVAFSFILYVCECVCVCACARVCVCRRDVCMLRLAVWWIWHGADRLNPLHSAERWQSSSWGFHHADAVTIGGLKSLLCCAVCLWPCCSVWSIFMMVGGAALCRLSPPPPREWG